MTRPSAKQGLRAVSRRGHRLTQELTSIIDRSDRRRRLTRYLFQALGFGTVAGIALTGACGGNVVVDTPNGSGGTSTSTYGTGTGYPTGTVYSTGDVNPTTTTTYDSGVGGGYPVGTTGTGSGLCTPTLQPGQYAMTACLPSNSCSVSYTADLRANLSAVLDVCDIEPDSDCCSMPALDTIFCGPTFEPGGGCCYVATIYNNAPCHN